MTAFDKCFLFLDNPRGGIEDIAWLKQECPWVKGVFCNVHRYAPSDWEVNVLPRCHANGLFCGAWGRTAKLDDAGNPIEPAVFDPNIVDRIIATADRWVGPALINPEKELDGHQGALDYIVRKVGDRDAALSCQPNPFASIDWLVASHLPVLPQIFPAEAPGYWPVPTRQKWWDVGIKCVYMTFGTYGGMKPADFDLIEPYSLFTGDVIMSTLSAPLWAPTSSGWIACKKEEVPIPMPDIGSQHGIAGFMSWLKAQPNVPPRGPGYKEENINTWPWPDKLERTLTLLVEDHDKAV